MEKKKKFGYRYKLKLKGKELKRIIKEELNISAYRFAQLVNLDNRRLFDYFTERENPGYERRMLLLNKINELGKFKYAVGNLCVLTIRYDGNRLFKKFIKEDIKKVNRCNMING